MTCQSLRTNSSRTQQTFHRPCNAIVNWNKFGPPDSFVKDWRELSAFHSFLPTRSAPGASHGQTQKNRIGICCFFFGAGARPWRAMAHCAHSCHTHPQTVVHTRPATYARSCAAPPSLPSFACPQSPEQLFVANGAGNGGSTHSPTGGLSPAALLATGHGGFAGSPVAAALPGGTVSGPLPASLSALSPSLGGGSKAARSMAVRPPDE